MVVFPIFFCWKKISWDEGLIVLCFPFIFNTCFLGPLHGLDDCHFRTGTNSRPDLRHVSIQELRAAMDGRWYQFSRSDGCHFVCVRVASNYPVHGTCKANRFQERLEPIICNVTDGTLDNRTLDNGTLNNGTLDRILEIWRRKVTNHQMMTF